MMTPRTLTLHWKQRLALVEQRDHAPQPYVRERCGALLKIADGRSPHWLARHGLLKPRDPDTVYQWLNWFEAEGVPAVCAHPHGGQRRTSPTDSQLAELGERMCHPPEAADQAHACRAAAMPPPSRWSLIVVRQQFECLHDYTLSGVWRVLRRLEIEWKHGYLRPWSPDPDYVTKVEHIEECLKQAVLDPRQVVALFLDEMGYYRWPNPSRDWRAATHGSPLSAHGDCSNQQWRVIGALNARTGRLTARQNYIIGRQQVIE